MLLFSFSAVNKRGAIYICALLLLFNLGIPECSDIPGQCDPCLDKNSCEKADCPEECAENWWGGGDFPYCLTYGCDSCLELPLGAVCDCDEECFSGYCINRRCEDIALCRDIEGQCDPCLNKDSCEKADCPEECQSNQTEM